MFTLPFFPMTQTSNEFLWPEFDYATSATELMKVPRPIESKMKQASDLYEIILTG
jgi:hypothetical protein